MLPNYPITKADIMRAQEILVPKWKNDKDKTLKGNYREI